MRLHVWSWPPNMYTKRKGKAGTCTQRQNNGSNRSSIHNRCGYFTTLNSFWFEFPFAACCLSCPIRPLAQPTDQKINPTLHDDLWHRIVTNEWRSDGRIQVENEFVCCVFFSSFWQDSGEKGQMSQVRGTIPSSNGYSHFHQTLLTRCKSTVSIPRTKSTPTHSTKQNYGYSSSN